MSIRLTPLQAALMNSATSSGPFQRVGMDGSDHQVNQNQQGNRTTTQGDQALDSNGGTGGMSGGAAGPGGGPGGASGASSSTSGGSNGASGGPPMSGQESGRIASEGQQGYRISYDVYGGSEVETIVTFHFGAGYAGSDMSRFGLFMSVDVKTVECTAGCIVCKCNAI